jgi:hypothetical protein
MRKKMAAQDKPGLYKVVSVIERMDIDSKGRFQRMIEIGAVTVSGIEFTVLMTKAEFTKESSDKRLTKEATELEAVKKLSK